MARRRKSHWASSWALKGCYLASTSVYPVCSNQTPRERARRCEWSTDARYLIGRYSHHAPRTYVNGQRTSRPWRGLSPELTQALRTSLLTLTSRELFPAGLCPRGSPTWMSPSKTMRVWGLIVWNCRVSSVSLRCSIEALSNDALSAANITVTTKPWNMRVYVAENETFISQ